MLFRTVIAICCGQFLFGADTFASELPASQVIKHDIDPQNLQIDFTLSDLKSSTVEENKQTPDQSAQLSESAAAAAAELTEMWRPICAGLRSSLSRQGGPYGTGVFSDVQCTHDGKKLRDEKDILPEWRLTIRAVEPSVSIVLEQMLFDKKGDLWPYEKAKISLPYTALYFDVFASASFRDLLSLWVSQSMPMAYYFGSTAPNQPPAQCRLPIPPEGYQPTWTFPPPPEKLVIYSASFARKKLLWELKNYGSAAPKFDETTCAWELDAEATKNLVERPQGAWAHDEKGPKAANDEYIKQLGIAWSETIAKTLATPKYASYAALRFGPQFLSGSQLLKGAVMIGLLAEFRGGTLSGWNTYFDLIPRVTSDNDGLTETLTWLRWSVGRTFGLEFDFFANRLEFTPKLGIWRLDASLAVSDQVVTTQADGTTVESTVRSLEDIKIPLAPSLAVDLGIARRRLHYTLRAWAGYDAALEFVSKNASGSAKFAGVEGVWNSLVKIRGYDCGILGYALFQTITLRNPKLESDSTADTGLTGVNIESAFIGTGLTIAW